MKIVISVALATLLFVGCSEEKSKPVEAVVPPAKAPTVTVATAQKIDKIIESASKSAQEMSDTTVEKTKEIVQSAQIATSEAVEATKEVTKEAAEVVAVEVQASAAAVSQKVDAVLAPTNEAGQTVYKACASCHGQNAEKPALGKSQVIKGWSVAKLKNSLKGYVDGTYGGAMKAIMKGQAERLSADETQAVSEYISGL